MTFATPAPDAVELLEASVRRDQQRDLKIKRQVQEDGDATLFAWGDAKREGEIEAILHSRGIATEDNGRKVSGGPYSNPVLSALLQADSMALSLVLLVEREVEWWREDKNTRLWAQIADRYYCAAGHATNGSVARALNVSERTVERCRGQMRRIILMAARRAACVEKN